MLEGFRVQFSDETLKEIKCYELRLKDKSKRTILYYIIQENLMKFLSIIYLFYICWAHSLCYTKPSLL